MGEYVLAKLILKNGRIPLTTSGILRWGNLGDYFSLLFSDSCLWILSLRARETEHPQQTVVLTKTAGQQPGSGHFCLRSSVHNLGRDCSKRMSHDMFADCDLGPLCLAHSFTVILSLANAKEKRPQSSSREMNSKMTTRLKQNVQK